MRNKITISKSLFFIMILTCIMSLVSSVYFVGKVYAKEDSDRYSFLKIFTDVLAIVEKNYVEQVDMEELVEGSVKGMLLTLDPHSSYMNKETFKELQVETQGKFGGLGIEITIKDGVLTVVSPIEDSPAYRAGIQSGDQIIKIGGEFAKDMSLVDAVKKMRGIKGTSIKLSIHREGRRALIPVSIVRDEIKVKSIRWRMLKDGLGYVRLAQFQDGSSKEFKKALKNISQKLNGQVKGLVLDLRNNPGGLLTEAVRISDLFLKDGVIVYTEGRLASQKQKYFAHDDKVEPNFPIVVIVNEGSASASEIVSGAFQDHARALVIGEQTFGKGSVQTVIPMEQGDALRLTTALYFTQSGRSIQAQGVSPDIEVKQPKKKIEYDEDEVEEFSARESNLPGAIKNPNKKAKTKKAKEEAKVKEKKQEDQLRIGSRQAMKAELPKLLEIDKQLEEAIKILNNWSEYEGKIGSALENESKENESSKS